MENCWLHTSHTTANLAQPYGLFMTCQNLNLKDFLWGLGNVHYGPSAHTRKDRHIHQVGVRSNHLMRKSAVASMGICKHQPAALCGNLLSLSSNTWGGQASEDPPTEDGKFEEKGEVGFYIRPSCIIHKESIKKKKKKCSGGCLLAVVEERFPRGGRKGSHAALAWGRLEEEEEEEEDVLKTVNKEEGCAR